MLFTPKNRPFWRKATVLSVLTVFAVLLLQAQTSGLSQTIKGTIIDQASEEPIIAANILVLNVEPVIGTATEADGSFRLENVPLGRHSLRISCLGYDDAFVHELEVGSGKEVVLQIKLTESLVVMEEVVVKADRLNGTPNNEMASVSARSFSVEQTKRYAAAVNDPARMALSFAGVTTQDDGGNEIVIRGNSPRGLLWRMEGVEIPTPNHFSDQGASGGGISALSVNMLANSDFLVSAYPAEYGNALSGVFDLKLRNGNNEKREYALQAGFLGLDLAAEGPIGPKGGASYLANYRYSTLSILGKLGVIDVTDGESVFQDAAFKVQIPTKGGGYWSVWGLGGLSSDVYQDSIEQYDYHSNRGVLGVNHRRYLAKNDYLETILSYSVNEIGDDDRYLPTNYKDSEQFTTEALRASLLYNRKLNARSTFRLGAIASRLSYRFEDWYEADAPRVTLVDEDGSTSTLQAYAQWKHRLGTTLHLNAGLHATYLQVGDQLAIEPRLGLRWNFRPGQVLSAGAGLHSRRDPLTVYFARVSTGGDDFTQPNKDLALPKAAHAVLGYEWRFSPQWRLQAEVYYQHLYDVAIASPSAQEGYAASASALNFNSGYVADSLFSDGTGRNYGLEVTIEKFFTNGWYALGTVSLYESLYTARDGVERGSRYNGNYVSNLLVGKEWSVGRNKTNVLGANIRGSLAGGNRWSPIDLEASQLAGHTVRDYSRAWEEQGAYYFRTDIRISYRKNRAKTSSIFSLDIQNVSNRENVFTNYYSPVRGEIRTETQLGLIPILNYRLEF